MSKTVTRSITLPASVFFKNVGGKAINLPFANLPESVLGEILTRAGMVVLNNSFNSGGKEVKEDVRLSRAMKRWDAWLKGSYEIVERATAQATLMRECYVTEQLAKHEGSSADSIEKQMKATVKEVLGEGTNATFDNFLQALGKIHGGDDADKQATIYNALVKRYEAAAAELEAERAKAASGVKIDVTAINLDDLLG